MRRALLPDKIILDLPDCESLTENGGCTRLNTPKCIGTDCSFFSRSGDDSSSERWKQRLAALNESEQIRISRKYYGGAMPWKR